MINYQFFLHVSIKLKINLKGVQILNVWKLKIWWINQLIFG